jgi:hypothetical protein
MERRTEKGKEKTLRACERVNIKIKGVCWRFNIVVDNLYILIFKYYS